jgi:hypothetical protein
MERTEKSKIYDTVKDRLISQGIEPLEFIEKETMPEEKDAVDKTFAFEVNTFDTGVLSDQFSLKRRRTPSVNNSNVLMLN